MVLSYDGNQLLDPRGQLFSGLEMSGQGLSYPKHHVVQRWPSLPSEQKGQFQHERLEADNNKPKAGGRGKLHLLHNQPVRLYQLDFCGGDNAGWDPQAHHRRPRESNCGRLRHGGAHMQNKFYRHSYPRAMGQALPGQWFLQVAQWRPLPQSHTGKHLSQIVGPLILWTLFGNSLVTVLTKMDIISESPMRACST